MIFRDLEHVIICIHTLQILRLLEDPLGQSLTRRRLNRIRIELAEYLETKVTGGGVRELFDFAYSRNF